MAIICFPKRFGSTPLSRGGRNTQAQTTKGWPDAYVMTGPATVDGIEATRDQQSWKKHLTEDLKKAKSPEQYDLSGYFFVAGYPDSEPSKSELDAWTKEFSSLGIDEANIQILVGRHLAFELADSKYARLRQQLLGIPSSALYFEELVAGRLGSDELDEIRPSVDDFARDRVFSPDLTKTVVNDLVTQQVSFVRGHGACGKTTLAQVISVDAQFLRFPFFYFDIASEDQTVAVGEIKNELVELSGSGVVFVIDNIHLDEKLALALYSHWETYCKPAGARLLLLGRETRSEFGSSLGSLKPHVLRAGVLEMRGVLTRLFSRKDLTVPRFTDAEVDSWLHTFGGVRKGRHKTVDLIAFSAAVQSRTSQLLNGDARLEETDAINAIDQRYLQKVRSRDELANLITLASLAEYELPIPRSALPFPDAGLIQVSRELGIVFVTHSADSGNARFSLAHPALGRLILAARASTDARWEREKAVQRIPHLGFRILTRLKYPDERDALVETLRSMVSDDAWVSSCATLQDLMAGVSTAIRLKISTREKLDSLGSSEAFRRIVRNTRNINTRTAIAGWARRLRLPRIAAGVYATPDNESIDRLKLALVSSSPGDVLGFLRNTDKPCDVIGLIDKKSWERASERVPPDIASTTSQLVRLLEKLDAAHLAQAPARAFICSPTGKLFEKSDLGDISNIVRAANTSVDSLRSFFSWLKASGKLDICYEKTRLGQLCGSLTSFSNYVPDELRPDLLMDSLRIRVDREVRIGVKGDGHAIARSVCIIGAASTFWNNTDFSNEFIWPAHLNPANVFASRAATNEKDEGFIGMYELQFWLGLHALARVQKAPSAIDGAFGDAATARLKRTNAPTELGKRTSKTLLDWMQRCSDNGWTLVLA